MDKDQIQRSRDRIQKFYVKMKQVRVPDGAHDVADVLAEDLTKALDHIELLNRRIAELDGGGEASVVKEGGEIAAIGIAGLLGDLLT